MPTTPSTINYYIAADGTLRDGSAGSIAQTPRIYYGTEYAVTLSFPPSTIAEGDQLQVALNRTRTFFSSASATGDAPVAAVVKHDVTAEEAAAQAVTLTLSTNTRAMIDQVNGIDHPVRGFFGVHLLRGQSFISLAVADAFMLSVESGPDAISPSLPVVDYPTREEAEALTERSENAAERAEQAAAGIVPPLQLSAPPTTSTAGSVGQLAVWHDGDSDKDHLYHLVYITTSDSATLYHWEECVLVSQGNVAGGYPVLDANGKVAAAQLPQMDYIPTEGQIIGNTESSLLVEPAKFYDWRPAATTATLNVATGVDTSKAWCSLIRLAKGSLSLISSSTITLKEGTWRYLQPITFVLVVCDGAAVTAYNIITKDMWASSSNGGYGVVALMANSGIGSGNGAILISSASYNIIDARTEENPTSGTSQNKRYPIVPATIDYAVRSVLPNVTEIPAATSDYSLVDSSATTLNHSHTFVHTPSQAPTYRLPSVSDTTVSHYIELTVDFTNVQTYSFLDANGDALVPLFTPSIAAGDVYTFRMEYSAIKAAWLIYPQKQGAVADDFVMRGEVGAANGVAGLDGNGTVPNTQIPRANTGVIGGVAIYASGNYGLAFQSPALPNLTIKASENTLIDSRSNNFRPITAVNLNYAVTAALTDSKKISLNDVQKAAAQEVFGVGGPITEIPAATSEYTLSEGIFKHAPTNAPTYNLPAITDTIRTHVIVLAIDFSSVQTFSFVPPQDSDITFQSYANPNQGDVWVFRCVWYGGKWRICPLKIKNCVTRQLTSGALAITDAVRGNALGLNMTAPRSVVLNQHIDTTDTSVTLTDGRTWLTYVGGVSEKVTGTGQSVACTGGTDMAVDLTQYFNNDSTLISSITSWDDLVTYDPRFAQYVEYNTGTVAGVQPQVKVTGKNLFDEQYPNLDGNIRILNIYVGNNSVTASTDYSGASGNILYIQAGKLSVYSSGFAIVDSNHPATKQAIDGYVTLAYRRPLGYPAISDYHVQLELGSSATAYEPYRDGVTAQAPSELFAVGNAADEYEAVSGVTTHKMASVDMGTLNWIKLTSENRFLAELSDKVVNSNNVILSDYYINSYADSLSGIGNKQFGCKGGGGTRIYIKDSEYDNSNADQFKAHMNGVMCYYDIITPTTFSTTPAQISLQAGSNVAMQTDGGRLADIDVTYESNEI